MGIGDFISGIFGSKNEDRANVQDVQVDPNAYQYGGAPGGAAAAAGRAQTNANGSYGIGAGYTNTAAGLAGRGGGMLDQSNQARGQQQQATDLMMRRAMGQTPSIAQMQADRQMQQAQAAQMQGAASARGPAALALAQQTAANNIANAQGAISNQAQVNAAQERLAAEQAAFGAASGMRQGDVAGAQTAYGASAQQGQLGLGFGQLGLGQDTLGHSIQSTQLAAQQNQQAQQSANRLGVAGINAGVGGQNAAMNQQNAMNLVGMAQSFAGGAAGSLSDIRTKMYPRRENGGPVSAGQPYLVGERGPEVMALYEPPGMQLHQSLDGRAFLAAEPTDAGGGGASLSGPAPRYSSAAPVASAMRAPSGARPPPRDLMREAEEMERQMRTAHEGRMAEGPAVQARAEGGPVSGGAPYVVGERGPEVVVPQQDGYVIPNDQAFAPSTWGSGGPDIASQLEGQRQQAQVQALQREYAGYKDPWTRERDRVALRSRMHPEWVTPEDRASGRFSQAVINEAQRTKGAPSSQPTPQEQSEREAVVEGKAVPSLGSPKAGGAEQPPQQAEPPTFRGKLAGALGKSGKEMMDRASHVDVSYRGTGGYIPPQLIPLAGARALGGPVDAGKPYLVGEQGAEAVVPIGAASPVAPASFAGAGGMLGGSPMGELKAHSNFATRFQSDPSGGMVSDERAKQEAYNLGRAHQLEMSSTGKAPAGGFEYELGGDVTDKSINPKKFGAPEGAVQFQAQRPETSSLPPTPAEAKMSPEETARRSGIVADKPRFPGIGDVVTALRTVPATMSRMAGATQGNVSDERAKNVLEKEAPTAAANRAQEGSPYAYKPEFTPPEQEPGELNVGPMAQTMAKDPIAGTAVKEGPGGLLHLDGAKLDKVQSAGIASLQRQLDALSRTMLRSRMRRAG